jgi:hypothetical protein
VYSWRAISVGLPTVGEERHLKLLRAGDVGLLHLQPDRPDGLGPVEGDDQGLLARLRGDPARRAWASSAVEGEIDGMVVLLRAHEHAGERRDVENLRGVRRLRRCRSENLLAKHGAMMARGCRFP